MSICHIVGAADFDKNQFRPQEQDYIIACDAGLLHLDDLGVKPNYVLGDFDSLGYVPKVDNLEIHPVRKDDTDTMIAIKQAVEMGYNKIVFHGCTGGSRFDHTLANIQGLIYAANHDAQAYLVCSQYTLTCIKNTYLTYSSDYTGDFSVFAVGKDAHEVTMIGLNYEISQGTILHDDPLGVSNAFIGKDAKIEVSDGTLLIYHSDTNHPLVWRD